MTRSEVEQENVGKRRAKEKVGEKSFHDLERWGERSGYEKRVVPISSKEMNKTEA